MLVLDAMWFWFYLCVVNRFSKTGHFILFKKEAEAIANCFSWIWFMYTESKKLLYHIDMSNLLATFGRHYGQNWEENFNSKVCSIASLENLLCCLVWDQTASWDSILPISNFGYSSSMNRSIDWSASVIVLGMNPRQPIGLVQLSIHSLSVQGWSFCTTYERSWGCYTRDCWKCSPNQREGKFASKIRQAH